MRVVSGRRVLVEGAGEVTRYGRPVVGHRGVPVERARCPFRLNEVRLSRRWDPGEETNMTRREGNALLDRISVDPAVVGGRPCIKGTRMRVSDIVDMLAHGATHDEILKDYPYLVAEDIAAALAYAARATDHRVILAA